MKKLLILAATVSLMVQANALYAVDNTQHDIQGMSNSAVVIIIFAVFLASRPKGLHPQLHRHVQTQNKMIFTIRERNYE